MLWAPHWFKLVNIDYLGKGKSQVVDLKRHQY